MEADAPDAIAVMVLPPATPGEIAPAPRLDHTDADPRRGDQRRVLRVGCDATGLVLVRSAVEADYEAAESDLDLQLRPGDHAELLRRLLEGNVDLVVTSEGLSHKERRRGLVDRRLMRIPLVPIVHPGNPVRTISRTALAEVLSGERRSWFELNQRQQSIEVIALAEGTLARRLTARLFAGRSLLAHVVVDDPAAAIAHVATEPTAIALVPQPLGASREVRVLAVDGRSPEEWETRAGRYPLTVDVHIVTASQPVLPVLRFLSFVAGSGVRSRLRSVGYPD